MFFLLLPSITIPYYPSLKLFGTGPMVVAQLDGLVPHADFARHRHWLWVIRNIVGRWELPGTRGIAEWLLVGFFVLHRFGGRLRQVSERSWESPGGTYALRACVQTWTKKEHDVVRKLLKDPFPFFLCK